MTSLLSWFRSKPTGLICPFCEKAIEGHDEAACERRMSRRFFFQVAAGAAAVAVISPTIITSLTDSLVSPRGNTFLSTEQISLETLNIFSDNFSFDDFSARYIAPAIEHMCNEMDMQILNGPLYNSRIMIGDSLQVRKPRGFSHV